MRVIFSALGLLFISLQGQAQTPIGSEFEVVTDLVRGPLTVEYTLPGEFVVAWHGGYPLGHDGDFYEIGAQRLAASGQKLGDVFFVNSSTSGDQEAPDIAVNGDGSFIVVWHGPGSSGTDTSSDSIQAQFFDPLGVPVSSEFQVNSFTTGAQRHPAIASGPEDTFTVVWQSQQGSEGDPDSSIQGQRFGLGGSPLGNEFQVNSQTTGPQTYPAVAINNDGSFLVAWEADFVQAQAFDADGNESGSEFQVNSDTSDASVDYRDIQVVAISGGDFVVVWAGSYTGDSRGVVATRVDRFGSSVGDNFLVNASTTGTQERPVAAANSQGNFVVTWQSSASPYLVGQQFASDASRLGTEFTTNAESPGGSGLRLPDLAVSGTGEFVIVWDGPPYSASGQRYLASWIFSDGFETGDTERW